MTNGVKVAAAIGAGYLLGRTRKTRLAFMLAAAGVTGKFPARPSDLVIQGVKSLGSTEQVHELNEQLRSGLMAAAQAAAVAAATSQVDRLNNRLLGVDLDADEPVEGVGEVTAKKAARRTATPLAGRKASTTDQADDYDDEVDVIEGDDVEDADVLNDQDVDEEPEAPVRRRGSMRQSAPAKTAGRRSSRAAAHDEPRIRAARRRSSASASESPVRRSR